MHLHRQHAQFAAVFHGEHELSEAIADLDQLEPGNGAGPHHLKLEVHVGHGSDLAAAEHTVWRDLGVGMAIGAPIGMVTMAGLLAVIAVVIDAPSVGVYAAAGLGPGAIFGLLFGGLSGLAAGNKAVPTALRWESSTADDGDAVLVTEFDLLGNDDDFSDRVAAVIRRHHGEALAGSSL